MDKHTERMMKISDIVRIPVGVYLMYLGIIGIYKAVHGFSSDLISVVILIFTLVAGCLFVLAGFVMVALPFLRKIRKRRQP